MKKCLTILVLCLLILNVSSRGQIKISFKNPPSTPTLFGTGIITTGLAERDFALSPDENELFYTIQSPLGYFQTIVWMKKNGEGNWSKPEVAPFAGMYTDLEPAFSPDGNRIYFASNRPISGNKIKDFDIWYVDKINGSWTGVPVNMGAPINTEANEFYPSVTKTGNLYFTANYKIGVGREDIFMAQFRNGQYQTPMPLDTAVNSKFDEFNAFVSPTEDYILFTSYGRKEDMGRSDLYISLKDSTGKWQLAKHLPLVSSNRIDYCPFVSFDQKKLFFTSERNTLKQHFDNPITIDQLKFSFTSHQNGSGDIYWIDFGKVLASIK